MNLLLFVAKPTIEKLGKPFVKVDSTITSFASISLNVADLIDFIINFYNSFYYNINL